jgi:hypothetical protein
VYWYVWQQTGKKCRTTLDPRLALTVPIAVCFTAGINGGQRKLLLFELICQRTADQSNLLLVFDEPFACVTDDFVPFIVDRLNE